MCNLLIFALGLATCASQGGNKIGLSVGLDLPKSEYLRGEPVQIDLLVRNTSGEPIRMAPIQRDELECTCIMISENNGDFKGLVQGVPGFSPDLPIALGDGDSRFYRLMVFNSVGDVTGQEPMSHIPSGLAFARAGEYRIKVAFPFRRQGDASNTPLESNAVAIRVREPMGREVAAWDRINSREILDLPRYAGFSEVKPDTTLRLMDAYQSSIGTGYQESWGRILRRACRHFPNPPAGELARCRDLLDLPDLGDPFWRLYPEDERLDRRVEIEAREEMEVSELVRMLSHQGRINLEADVLAGEISLRLKGEKESLRSVMQEIARVIRGKWVRSGPDGYKLKSPLDFRRDGPARLPIREAFAGPGRAHRVNR